MLITARKQGAPRLRDGVLGHARSHDLATWELQPPLTEPAGFGEFEVAQARVIDGQPLLLFTCHPGQQAPEQLARFGRFCAWSAPGASLTGPWDIAAARPLQAEPDLYAAQLVQRRDGTPRAARVPASRGRRDRQPGDRRPDPCRARGRDPARGIGSAAGL